MLLSVEAKLSFLPRFKLCGNEDFMNFKMFASLSDNVSPITPPCDFQVNLNECECLNDMF